RPGRAGPERAGESERREKQEDLIREAQPEVRVVVARQPARVLERLAVVIDRRQTIEREYGRENRGHARAGEQEDGQRAPALECGGQRGRDRDGRGAEP